MKNKTAPKSSFSHLTIEKSLSTFEVPGNAVAIPPQKSLKNWIDFAHNSILFGMKFCSYNCPMHLSGVLHFGRPASIPETPTQ